jgi:hypothetical protein
VSLALGYHRNDQIDGRHLWWRLAPVSTTDKGAPPSSTRRRLIFAPSLPLSVGLLPTFSPPKGAGECLESIACHFQEIRTPAVHSQRLTGSISAERPDTTLVPPRTQASTGFLAPKLRIWKVSRPESRERCVAKGSANFSASRPNSSGIHRGVLSFVVMGASERVTARTRREGHPIRRKARGSQGNLMSMYPRQGDSRRLYEPLAKGR